MNFLVRYCFLFCNFWNCLTLYNVHAFLYKRTNQVIILKKNFGRGEGKKGEGKK